jgi:hypothetical protein
MLSGTVLLDHIGQEPPLHFLEEEQEFNVRNAIPRNDRTMSAFFMVFVFD